MARRLPSAAGFGDHLRRQITSLPDAAVPELSHVAASIATRLDTERATADTLRRLDEISQRTDGRFARWADERSTGTGQVSERAGHQWTFCALGETAKKGLATLLITPTCVMHD